jgi:NitT/TauT family transport system ATP-binding protein
MTLAARNLSVTYTSVAGDQIEAIKDLSIEIPPGEFVSIIGPSGCGKSTLLHCLGGMITPSGGEITFDGRPVTGPNPNQAAFVFQDYTLLPWKDVLDNAAVGLRFAGVSKAERRERAEEMLELVGLSDFLSKYPSELSGGMQQRVAIARAMVMGPEALLMDEPFGALDEQTRRRLGFEMSRILAEANRTVVMVTHSLDEAIVWADRIIVMSARPGRIVREIRVPDPRPRQPEFIASPGFAEVRAELFQLLESTQGSKGSAANSNPTPPAVAAEVG